MESISCGEAGPPGSIRTGAGAGARAPGTARSCTGADLLHPGGLFESTLSVS